MKTLREKQIVNNNSVEKPRKTPGDIGKEKKRENKTNSSAGKGTGKKRNSNPIIIPLERRNKELTFRRELSYPRDSPRKSVEEIEEQRNRGKQRTDG